MVDACDLHDSRTQLQTMTDGKNVDKKTGPLLFSLFVTLEAGHDHHCTDTSNIISNFQKELDYCA